MSCLGCSATLDCGNIPDNALYSLEDAALPFVFDCPQGLDCSFTNLNAISLKCCNQTLSATFPSGAPLSQIISIVNDLINQCAKIANTCGEFQYPPPNTPGTPPVIRMFFSRPQSCTVFCPDGSPFTYSVRGGIAAAFSQEKADSLAKQIACQGAQSRRICLSSLSTSCCVGTAFSTQVSVSGNIVLPATWEIVSGALPDGLTLGGFGNIDTTIGKIETIEGTPTVAGTFNFTLRVLGTDGSYIQKAYTICASDITPHTLPNGNVGIVYSQSLSTSGCLGTVTWSISAGALPDGLSLNATTGAITGTPTSSASFNFTVKATGSTSFCTRAYTVTIDNPGDIFLDAVSFATISPCIVGLAQGYNLVQVIPDVLATYDNVNIPFQVIVAGSFTIGVEINWEIWLTPDAGPFTIYRFHQTPPDWNDPTGVYTLVSGGFCGSPATITVSFTP